MKRLASVVTLLMLAFAFTACREEGPMEKAGRQVDEAMDQASRQIDEAVDETKKKMEMEE